MSNSDDNLTAVESGKKGNIETELSRMRAAEVEIRRMRISAQRELQLMRQVRVEAERNLREIEIKARSQTQLLIIQTRLATKKEIAEFSRKVGQEMQKALADIRLIRSTAQKELETQQKFTNAARLKALSLVFPEEDGQESESLEGTIGVRKV